MKNFLLATIELDVNYKPNPDIIIEDYTSGVFNNSIGNILINKIEGGVPKFFKLIKIFRPMVELEKEKYIVYSEKENKFYNVEEEGLVKLAYENKI